MIRLCSLSASPAGVMSFPSIRRPDPVGRIVLGLKAIALGLFAHVLMFGIELVMELSSFHFPSSILTMFLLFVFLLALGCCWEGLEGFYIIHLRQPANLVNRHMSIGFTVPIVMLARGPVASSDTIARIIACFITAGIVSTAAIYLMAVGSQGLLGLCGRYLTSHRRCLRTDDEEATLHHKNRERATGQLVGVLCCKLQPSTSDISSASSFQDCGHQSDRENTERPADEREPPSSVATTDKPLARIVVECARNNPLVVSSWASTLLLCIPLRYGASIEEPLGISLLLALWTTTQTLQTTIRRDTLILARLIRPKLRIALSVACNPVLWTALGLVAYAKAEQHRSHRPIDVVLSTLERNTTFTDLIMHRTHPSTETYINFRLVPSSETENPPAASWLHRPTPAIAAGDVANAILSAGLVCWGLKLWEYRRRLLSSAGLTILLVSCAAAAGNVVLGPLLARRMLGSHGAQPGYDLAFAARTVTLALGAPAVARLGGDVGLNAAMVVVNGIMFQMLLGLGAGGWLLRVTGGLKGGLGGLSRRFRLGFGRAAEPDGTAETGDRGSGRDGVVTRSTSPARVVPHSEQGQQATTASAEPRNTTTIASGVTVGINAAAMGTAHLYEAGSDAAPYAALAMTIFGVATVGFTMIPQLGGWVAAAVQ